MKRIIIIIVLSAIIQKVNGQTFSINNTSAYTIYIDFEELTTAAPCTPAWSGNISIAPSASGAIVSYSLGTTQFAKCRFVDPGTTPISIPPTFPPGGISVLETSTSNCLIVWPQSSVSLSLAAGVVTVTWTENPITGDVTVDIF